MRLVPVGCCQVGPMFLVQRWPPEAQRGGLWEFPGGKRELGETMAPALRRGWLEELGAVIEVHEMLTECVLSSPDAPDVVLQLFRVSLPPIPGQFPRRAPRAQEGQEVAWRTLEQLSVMPMVPTMKEYWPALRELQENRVSAKDLASMWEHGAF